MPVDMDLTAPRMDLYGLVRTRMDLLLDLIHLLFHPAEPIVQCLFHFGGVYAAILGDLSALDDIGALESS